MNIVRRAIRKPPRIIAFRLAQELRLKVMHQSRAWSRLQHAIARWWSVERIQHTITVRHRTPCLMAADAPAALHAAARHNLLDLHHLCQFGSRIRDRNFELLGTAIPAQGAWPWHRDWRTNHDWRPGYFQHYNFYTPDLKGGVDVKIPWELSRLGFILPLLQNAAIEPEHDWCHAAIEIIADWEDQNPLAYSVNWYPMEAAIRVINLVLIFEMLLVLGKVKPARLAPLLRLITAHGSFIWRTLEYTDIRGNHYAAQLVALLLCGLILEPEYAEARKWRHYAVNAIPREIELQFLPDGVNFEKSIAYHRLVAELFLLGLLAMQRTGDTLAPGARDRLHAAYRYAAAYIRPDGLAPNVGDNDDARLLGYDPVPMRDHRPLIGTAAVFFQDGELKATSGSMSSAIPWLFGKEGIALWDKLPAVTSPGSRYFVAGGVVVSRYLNNFFWIDVGEVGLAGRGGHGHNDLLSFELVLNGHPLVVDPGCYIYTGDPSARDLFRSTAYHNGLRIDGIELAPMSGLWTIGPQAVPLPIEVVMTGVMLRVRASHQGYIRLADPVQHTRDIDADMQAGVLVCRDHLTCSAPHKAERYLHLDVAVEISIGERRAHLTAGAQRWIIYWDQQAQAQIKSGWVSHGYGQKQAAHILVLVNHIDRDTDLFFKIESLIG
jgi:hypothetical protein